MGEFLTDGNVRTVCTPFYIWIHFYASAGYAGQSVLFPGQHGLDSSTVQVSPLHTCTCGGIRWLWMVFSSV